jgi:aryl-alcohol dehydrogenase-like predicted oxidoreductase
MLGPDTPTLAALATRFVLSFPDVSSVLVGIDRMEYLEQTLRLADRPPLAPAVMDRLRGLAYPDPEFLDLPKWDRAGWLK